MILKTIDIPNNITEIPKILFDQFLNIQKQKKRPKIKILRIFLNLIKIPEGAIIRWLLLGCWRANQLFLLKESPTLNVWLKNNQI